MNVNKINQIIECQYEFKQVDSIKNFKWIFEYKKFERLCQKKISPSLKNKKIYFKDMYDIVKEALDDLNLSYEIHSSQKLLDFMKDLNDKRNDVVKRNKFYKINANGMRKIVLLKRIIRQKTESVP